ncbi:MAG: helix-turn-helix transcriptional regulator, partial [Bacteroidales bacterium]|nr:helix-turn-helix transcriptional regulator [Bacteroidales bacterium]
MVAKKSATAKAMNPIRIFWILCHYEECVVNIAAMMNMSSPATAHHLRLLKESGLIVSRKEG